MPISLTVAELRQAQRDTEAIIRNLGGPPLLQALRDSTLLVQRTARRYAKVDTGQYRASITPTVETSGRTVRGIVGSNLAHAPYAVLDTKPHWPPIAALQVWARRHGISAFLVARAIARRGTRGDRSLMRGLEENAARIYLLIAKAVDQAFGSKG